MYVYVLNVELVVCVCVYVCTRVLQVVYLFMNVLMHMYACHSHQKAPGFVACVHACMCVMIMGVRAHVCILLRT